MTSKEIRQSFMDFFKSKDHKIVPGAPVTPHGDPTLLFINAGMNQFKDVFLGTGKRDYKRAADTQKCIRVSGKHNDLEEVGVDTYHHTFFEMLGNWSFGDYYKEEAIAWAWELMVDIWKLDPTRLYATVYRTDDEAYELWKKFLPENHIQRFDEKDNFWEMGETGPCGPCSEIHYDITPDKSGAPLVNTGVPEVIEIWNLVFIQYNRKADRSLEDLSAKHVDTGMGFERIVAVIQNKSSNYDSDVFTPLINKIAEISGKKYSTSLTDPNGIAMRVIADHVRTLSFAIADGAIPGNEGRGYVLRRILRRGSRYARNLGMKDAVLYTLLPTLIDTMGDVFPELIEQKSTIEKIIKAEEESFLRTLERGLEKFEDIKSQLGAAKEIKGTDAFLLYDTFGFPLDLTELLARENDFSVDIPGFNENMTKQRERSRGARKVMSQEAELPTVNAKSEFIGYDNTSCEAEILYVNDNQIVLDKTPFYVESGGQHADTGTIVIAGQPYDVQEVRKSGDAIIHFCDRDVESLVGSKALVSIDTDRRMSISRNHSATHLLHQALYRVLGNHIKQAGSSVAPDALRFDFSHFAKVTDEDIVKIEKIVNDKILESITIDTQVLSLEEAQKNDNIKMFFGDKYGDEVRVVSMDSTYSQELCGGVHVNNTSEIGFFKITTEESIASGVRRIVAITGKAVNDYINDLHNTVADKNTKIDELNDKLKQLDKEINKMKIEVLKQSFTAWIDEAADVDGIKVVAREITAEGNDQIRTMGENLRDALATNGIGLLAAVAGEKVQLVCVVTDDLKKSLPAGKIVGTAAKQLGGGGGGKPHMATAGGKDASKLPELLAGFADIVKDMKG